MRCRSASPSRARRRWCTATTGSTTASSATTDASAPCSTGRSARSAIRLADLGMLQVYWTGPGDDPSAWGGSATTADGFLDRADLVDRYAAVSGRDISQLPFYVSFAYWKLACILQGRVLPLPRRRARIARSSRARTIHRPDRRCSSARRRVPRGAVMTDPYVLHEPLPTLRLPVMVVMLTGWIDASGAAAAAMTTVQEEWAVRPLATFDGDTFIDYRARRPTMELREGVNVRLVWADIELHVGQDSQGHDVLTLSGPEPDSQWRKFADVVSTLAVELGVQQMVALGAYPFATPHTRDPRLSSSSPSADVVANVPYLKNSVDVPAGMGAVLEHAFTEKGMPALGHLGAGSALRQRAELSGCDARTPHRPARRRRARRRCRGNSARDHHPTPTARPARCEQRRTSFDGQPTRRALRPGPAADRSSRNR